MTCSQSSPTTIRRNRAAWLVAIAAAIALGGASSTAQGQAQGQARGRVLFADDGRAEDAPGNADPTKRRGRRVRANVMALHDTSGPSAGDITLNLFDDVQLRARRQRLEPTLRGGSVWHGRLLDVAGDATIAVNDGVMAGTVFAEDRVYEILYAGDGEHEIREIEPSAFPTDDPHHDLPQVEPDAQAGELDPLVAANMAADSASQIDVMVVWTPAARTAAGGTAAMQSLVDLSVANTNTAYANSSVTQRIRLVYAGEVTYTESSISTDLSRLTSTADGNMDTVHSLRNTYGADVVTLIGNGYASAGACGLGYLMSYVSTGFASTAFNVVDRTCSAGNLSFPHELGHNMGLQHDPGNAGSSPAYSYAYGYQDPGGSFRTVMSYGGATRIKHFSNPSVSYGGKVTGTSTQNNALALNNTANSVANFRQATVGGSCTYSLGSSSTSVSSGSAAGTVSVIAGSGCNWTATSNAAWITVTSGASGTSNGSVGYSVAANTAGTSRTGTLTIGGQTFTVTQAAAACGAFSLSPTSTNVVAAGGAVNVTVSGTTGCARTATSNAAWITVTAGASGTGAGTVSLSVAANTAGTSRTGTVTIGGQTFTVTQAAAACGAFSLSPTSTNVVAAGGAVNVTVSGTTGCARTATSNAAWITVTAGASGTGAGTVSLSVAANTAGTSRTGTVTIGGQTFTVTQAAATCGAFSLSPTSFSAAAAGGTTSVTVSGTEGCARTATSNAAWITVTAGASGTGAGTVSLSVAANTAGTSRTGTVTVGGQTFTVTQASAACMEWGVTPQSYSAAAAGGTATVTAIGTSGCSRTASSNAAWISVTSGATGTGSGNVSLAIAANDGASRVGTATVAGKTVTVTQAGTAPVVVSALTANRSFPVPTGTALTWTATASGGSGTLEYQFWRYRSSTGVWSVVRDYSTTNSYSWTPTSIEGGSYALQVWVRSVGSTASYQAYRSFGTFEIKGAKPLKVTLTPADAFGPLVAGRETRWTAVADGGVAPTQFKFWVHSAETGWVMLQDYGTNGVLAWTPARPGRYALQAWVRNPGSTETYDAWTSTGYFDVVAGPQTVALEFSRPLPSPVNVPITLTAVGRGPAEPLEYQFWVHSDGAWSVLRGYSTTPTVVWTPTTPGNKAIQVWSRRVGAAAMEAWTSSGWVTIGNAPVTLTQFTANQTFPLPAGTPITWRAQASGGTAALQYQFWRLSNGAWTIVQPYGASNSYTWTPQSTDTGTHAVQVWVRSTGSTSAQEAWASSGYLEIVP